MIETKKVTAEDIIGWGLCDEYPPEWVRELLAGRERWSALEILELEIPPNDRLWAVLRPEFIAEPDLHELACQFAESVLPIFDAEYPGDMRPRNAIAAKRAWLEGMITDEELERACAASRPAARGLSWAAREASSAAWAAAWLGLDSARAAAWASESAAGGLAANLEIVKQYLKQEAKP